MNSRGETSQPHTFVTTGLFLLHISVRLMKQTIYQANEQPSNFMPMLSPKFLPASPLPRWRCWTLAAPLSSSDAPFLCITLTQKAHRNCLLPPWASTLAFCPLGSQGTIMPLFQAIAKPNLPHKLNGLHLKSVCVCGRLKEKTNRDKGDQREYGDQTWVKVNQAGKRSISRKSIFGGTPINNNVCLARVWLAFSSRGAAVSCPPCGAVSRTGHLLSRPTQPFSVLARLISSTMSAAGG